MTSMIVRLAPLSGIAFVATMIGVISFEGEELSENASPQQVLAHWADRADTRLLVTTLAAFALLFLVLFAASLRGALRSREHQEASASAVAFGGGVVAAAGLAVSAMVTLAAARAGGQGVAGTVVPLDHLTQSSWVPVTAGLAVMMLAAGLGGLLSGAFPKVICWAGMILGLALLTPGGVVAFMLSPLWIIAVSVLIYRRQLHTGAPTPPRRDPARAS